MALFFNYTTGVMGDQSLHCGMGILDVFGSCDLDLDQMTFIYELDLFAWRYNGSANINFVRQLSLIRLSKVIF